jgi:hypothetical protein
MIFSKELLFIHVPKTGGMSIGQYLLATLPRPVYFVRPVHEDSIQETGVVDVVEERHISLLAASNLVSRYGFDIRQFPLILAIIRNPYSLEVSRYAYLQHGKPSRSIAVSITIQFRSRITSSSMEPLPTICASSGSRILRTKLEMLWQA